MEPARGLPTQCDLFTRRNGHPELQNRKVMEVLLYRRMSRESREGSLKFGVLPVMPTEVGGVSS